MKVTHCPNCQTCFKVTDEQLKLYNGKVRCGRCAFVFNALNHLIEVEEMAAQTLHMPPNAIRQEAAAEKAAPRAVSVEETAAVTAVATATADTAEPPQPAVPAAAEPAPPPAEEQTPAPAEPDGATQAEAGDDNLFIPRAALQEALQTGAVAAETEAAAEVAAASTDAAEEIEIKAPAFADEESPTPAPPEQPVRAGFYVEPELDLDVSPPHELDEEPAQRPSRVFKPIAELNEPLIADEPPASRLKPLWLAGSALAVLLLTGQIAYLNRTQLATSLPGLKPVLEAGCRAVGCTIPLPADDSLISIESSELTPDGNQPNLIRLTATLLNKAEFDQALPLLELTLTDTNDQVVVKRVFEPAAYLDKSQPATSMPAKTELQALISLDTGETKAAGYRLFLFYPK